MASYEYDRALNYRNYLPSHEFRKGTLSLWLKIRNLKLSTRFASSVVTSDLVNLLKIVYFRFFVLEFISIDIIFKGSIQD
ncbi:UNVERIFIED_CONTAM: hypothetical protein NCL1_12124 [Trichonephila clavipes]